MEMAAEAAVSLAVETLGKLLIDKAEFLKGVEGDVEWLQKELKSMQGFLKDATKKQSDDEMIRIWISDIREVAHDAEDAIEMFVLKVQSKSLKKRYGCFPNHLYHLNKVGEQIKSIRQTLTDIHDRRLRYDIQKDEPSMRTKSREEIETRRRLAYWQIDKHVVGLDEDVKQLLRKAVFEKRKGLSVAAIVGMGGMGKSTLAGKVYNHPQVSRRFDIRSWVVVSSEFNPEDIMKQILLQLRISDDELKRLGSIDDKLARQEALKKKLHECLTGKRYFIVLDDVWEAAHWETLSTAFPHGDKGSRLLLTSRNQVITTADGYVHKMEPLGETESWDLFMRKAFGGNNGIDRCPDDLKDVGKEILKKCGGLPLAISVVGGLLAKKTRSKSEWEKVHKVMKSHLDRSGGDLSSITAILELSYHNLTPELKACFLCLGFFKEDAVIKVKNLVHIWVALGVVPQEVVREERTGDAARDYLNELISRNMVQVKEMECDQVRAFQMHDLLRDLSIRKANEEIDFEVVSEKSRSHQSLAKPRHRAIYCSEINFVCATNRNQHLRSLFVHREGRSYVSGGLSSYWKSFELLRVLDMGNTLFKQGFPRGIGELTGLRYLKIRPLLVRSRLPRSWAKLKNLEVLDLSGGRIKTNKVILKMVSLRHLYADVRFGKVDLGKYMRSLETLHLYWLETSSKLGIDMACMSSLQNLSHLTLTGFSSSKVLEGLTSLHRVTQLKLQYGLLPSYFPPNLSHLTLSRMRAEEEDKMAVLEKLPNLLYLKLTYSVGKNSNGIMVIGSSGGFPSLKFLCLRDMPVRKMVIIESAMPKLNQFIIRNCWKLDVESLPERIKSAIIVQPH